MLPQVCFPELICSSIWVFLLWTEYKGFVYFHSIPIGIGRCISWALTQKSAHGFNWCVLTRGLYRNIAVAVSARSWTVYYSPREPDIKLLFESYPGIMCCSTERLAWEEDAQGVITAITESHQCSQTYTFHSQQQAARWKGTIRHQTWPSMCNKRQRENLLVNCFHRKRGVLSHSEEKTLSVSLKRSAFPGTLMAQVLESCHLLSLLTAGGHLWEGSTSSQSFA